MYKPFSDKSTKQWHPPLIKWSPSFQCKAGHESFAPRESNERGLDSMSVLVAVHRPGEAIGYNWINQLEYVGISSLNP